MSAVRPLGTNRRAFLALAGGALAVALAGCQDSSESDGGDGNDGGNGDGGDGTDAGDGSSAGRFDCSRLEGDPVTYDPDVESFPFVFSFDYPDTWEHYAEGTSQQSVMVTVGHVDTKTTLTHPYTFRLHQFTRPVGPSFVETWGAGGNADSFDLAYGEETVQVRSNRMDERLSTWKFSLPVQGADGVEYYPVQLDAAGDRNESGMCADTLYALGTELVRSIRPLE